MKFSEPLACDIFGQLVTRNNGLPDWSANCGVQTPDTLAGVCVRVSENKKVSPPSSVVAAERTGRVGEGGAKGRY